MNRRRFMGLWGALGVGLVPGTSLVLVSCSDSGASWSVQSASQPTIWTTNATISIQARIVQLTTSAAPLTPNAWVYCADGAEAIQVLSTYLGPTFQQRRGTPCQVTFKNALVPQGNLLPIPPGLDPLGTRFCGNVQLQSDVGLTVHLHGARVQGHGSGLGIESDGWPLTPLGCTGNPFGFSSSQTRLYPNDQRATMLWYHDHAIDNTSTHVHAGLAGLYFIRDTYDDAVLDSVGGASQELHYAIQDRILTSNGQFFDYASGTPNQPDFQRPEFLGNTLIVNGKLATTVNLDPRMWRLRLLNGCNARTLALALCDADAIEAASGRVWYCDCLRLIGTDGGLMARSLALGATDTLVLAPGQRLDVLLDLSQVPTHVKRLRLVNVSLAYFLLSDQETPEAIYTTYDNSVLTPSNVNFDVHDSQLYSVLNNGLAVVQNINVNPTTSEQTAQFLTLTPAPNAIDQMLAKAAPDNDFVWNGSQLAPAPGATFGPNRFVLLISNTAGYAPSDPPSATGNYAGWSDVQIFELTQGGGNGLQWQVPFAVDLTMPGNPSPGQVSTNQVNYTVNRSTFFQNANAPDITQTQTYPPLHSPTIQAQSGTFERWYVTNVGNSQPMNGDTDMPDMHPFHIHLVSFVVLRRWKLVGTSYQLDTPDALDGIARLDTIVIPSNTMVELLLFYPPGYKGNYVYHCHILEHEDKCMMSHFSVT
jgi:FtsP/CotA-like multicopper oxidase with cupredoxin domain